MEYVHISHCVYHCEYHIGIVTKYRRAVFSEGISAYFEKKLAEIAEHYPLIKFGTVKYDKDHIHFLVSIPPDSAHSSDISSNAIGQEGPIHL